MVCLRDLVPVLLLLFVLFAFSQASREIVVGGSQDSWKIPPSNHSFDNWSRGLRFRVGDFLVWRYDPKADSVLEVSEGGYNACNTSNPLKEYKDGNTTVELNRSGPFYFISGAHGHCEQGQKVKVVVLSENHRPISPAPALAPAPGLSANAYGLKAGFLGGLMGLIILFGVGFLIS